MHKDGFTYLNKKAWEIITRDERTFCMYLFSAFRDNPLRLIDILKKKDSPYKNFENKLPLKGKTWELSYEVCFYRDLFFSYDKPIKKHLQDLKKSVKIKEPEKLIKRTFDLCLFSEKEIVIIEAKAHEPLTRSQFQDFSNDRDNIQKVFKFLKLPTIPNVYFVVLASSGYFMSPSFTLPNGVAKEFIIDKKVVNSLISWKQISMDDYFKGQFEIEKKMIERADLVYYKR